MEIVVKLCSLGNNNNKIHTCLVCMQFFSNIFNPWLVESTEAETTDREASCCTHTHTHTCKLNNNLVKPIKGKKQDKKEPEKVGK